MDYTPQEALTATKGAVEATKSAIETGEATDIVKNTASSAARAQGGRKEAAALSPSEHGGSRSTAFRPGRAIQGHCVHEADPHLCYPCVRN